MNICGMNKWYVCMSSLFLHKNSMVSFFLIYHLAFLSLHVIVSETMPISLSRSKCLSSMEIILTGMASYLNTSTNSFYSKISNYFQLPQKCSPNFPVRNHYFLWDLLKEEKIIFEQSLPKQPVESSICHFTCILLSFSKSLQSVFVFYWFIYLFFFFYKLHIPLFGMSRSNESLNTYILI